MVLEVLGSAFFGWLLGVGRCEKNRKDWVLLLRMSSFWGSRRNRNVVLGFRGPAVDLGCMDSGVWYFIL
jgi:hypothetical protein